MDRLYLLTRSLSTVSRRPQFFSIPCRPLLMSVVRTLLPDVRIGSAGSRIRPIQRKEDYRRYAACIRSDSSLVDARLWFRWRRESHRHTPWSIPGDSNCELRISPTLNSGHDHGAMGIFHISTHREPATQHYQRSTCGGSSPRREKHHSPREPGKVRGTGIITATDTALPRDASHSDNAVSCQ